MIALSSSKYLGHLITTEMLVWGICIGAILAFTVYFFQQHITGSLVRLLIKDCVGEDNAKTLDALGKNNAFYRHMVRDNSTLRRVVSVVGGQIPRDSDAERIYDGVRLYIDESALDRATKRFTKDVRLYMYIIGVVACLAVGVGMQFLLPFILSLLP